MEAGFLLRRLQRGESVSMPNSRPMPTIGPRCHELRIVDRGKTWRIIYRTDEDAVIVLEVFQKQTKQTAAGDRRGLSNENQSVRSSGRWN